MKKTISIVGLVAMLTLLGISCTSNTKLVQDNKQKEEIKIPEIQNEKTTNTISTLPLTTTSEEKIEKIVPKTITKPEITKCQTVDCLVKLAEKCEQGNFVYNYQVPFPEEMIVIGKTNYKINGKNNSGMCVLLQDGIQSSVTITEEGRKASLDKGLTEENINDQIKKMNDSMKTAFGMKITCTGKTSDLATYLRDALQNGKDVSSCSIGGKENETTCVHEPNVTCITRW